MDELTIYWTQTAVQQRDHIFEYWNNRTKDLNYSRKLNSSIKEKLNYLKSNPHAGKETSFQNYRMIAMKHYSIIYKQVGTDLFITAFWDNRQNPKTLRDLLKNN